ncbi:cytosine permease [Candidatus Epulonipiscium viviparus]|uniref:cytosine permease n=1 Tax=Candidatus Epulonipiscium viviparus TaxID=420336 RepID=UPI00273810CC|nr:cytosine permease [Candidatus Epulopiscium viviparus]
MKENSEIFALAPIPLKDRMSAKSMAYIQAGICVCVPSFLLGAILADSMSVSSGILSGTLGYLIVVVVMAILGLMGSDLGAATCTLAQAGMGVLGSRFIVSTVFALNLIGWFGINNAVCGEAFTNVLLSEFNIAIPVPISSIIWGIIMLSTAIFGMRAIEKLDKLSIPLLMFIMIMGTYLVIKKYGIASLNTEVEQTMSFMSGVGLSFNFYAIGAITPCDFTRFQKTRKDVISSTFWGVFPMGVITLIMGIIMAKLANNHDISMVLIGIGLPILGVASMILSTWTTNSTNAYTGALNTIMIFNISDNRRREVTLVVGLVGTILGAFGVLNYIEAILSMLACIACPIGGIMIADYFVVGKGKSENWHAVAGFNWAGVIAWAVGAVIAYILYIEYLGVAIGFVAYLILEKFMPSPSRGNNANRIVTELENSVIRL